MPMPVNHAKSPITQALDLAFFGPLGLALSAKDALPEWVDKGRSRIVHQVDVARMVGEHASRHGQKVVTQTLVGLGILPGPPPPAPPRPPAAPVPNGDGPDLAAGSPPAATNGRAGPLPPPGTPDERHATPAVAPMTAGGRAVADRAMPGRAELAIPGYDSLSAFQVVQRLAGLAPVELEAVRTYEAFGRGRRTILTKISQLQTGRS